MNILKAIVLTFTCLLLPSIMVAQSKAKDAEKTAGEIQNLLLEYGGSEEGYYEDFSVDLEGNITLSMTHPLIGDHQIVFKIDPTFYHTLKDGYYVFTAKGKEATIINEDEGKKVSSDLFSLKDADKEIADRLVRLFSTLDQQLKRVREERAEKEKEAVESKKAFYEKVKNIDATDYFVAVTIPNTPNRDFRKYTLFKNPLQVRDKFYSGFLFKPEEDGYLYWYFQSVKGSKSSFYIVDLDKRVDDVDVAYFRRMAFSKSTEADRSSWIIQKSNEKLRKGKTYVLWFDSESKIGPEEIKASFQLNNTDEMKVGEFFKERFTEIARDF
ncbi:hypothetical protein [Sphingobacterium sp. SYP-B4668]|uniref:hypothetical protein n=1 Tax=Sphingobacterium sp. SYP-B4668 TaxID=2996035 RepID=UPI0022DD7805|nr:hypothetical protein [Sphingobacterium sp. SYP-B4668]